MLLELVGASNRPQDGGGGPSHQHEHVGDPEDAPGGAAVATPPVLAGRVLAGVEGHERQSGRDCEPAVATSAHDGGHRHRRGYKRDEDHGPRRGVPGRPGRVRHSIEARGGPGEEPQRGDGHEPGPGDAPLLDDRPIGVHASLQMFGTSTLYFPLCQCALHMASGRSRRCPYLCACAPAQTRRRRRQCRRSCHVAGRGDDTMRVALLALLVLPSATLTFVGRPRPAAGRRRRNRISGIRCSRGRYRATPPSARSSSTRGCDGLQAAAAEVTSVFEGRLSRRGRRRRLGRRRPHRGLLGARQTRTVRARRPRRRPQLRVRDRPRRLTRPLYLAMRSYYGQRCGTAVDLGRVPRLPVCGLPPRRRLARFLRPQRPARVARRAGTTRAIMAATSSTRASRPARCSGPGRCSARGSGALKLDIPESGNGDARRPRRDPLEPRVDAHRCRMTDGGVWHKQTSEGFRGFVMPRDDALVSYRRRDRRRGLQELLRDRPTSRR